MKEVNLSPVVTETIQEARTYAIEQSKKNPQWFYYIIFKTSGCYLVDLIFIKSDDEIHLETFKNGDLEYWRPL